MNEINALRTAFENLDKITVGVFKPNVGIHKGNIRIIENDNGSLTCIVFSGMNFHTWHINAIYGRVLMFDNNLATELDDPIKFDKLLRDFDDDKIKDEFNQFQEVDGVMKCKCGHNAVNFRGSYICGTITAYPCKYT